MMMLGQSVSMQTAKPSTQLVSEIDQLETQINQLEGEINSLNSVMQTSLRQEPPQTGVGVQGVDIALVARAEGVRTSRRRLGMLVETVRSMIDRYEG